MKLISISGLDGSGKSTQIELLKNYFESQGKKVFYFHAVQFSVPQVLSNLAWKILGSERLNAHSGTLKEKPGITKASWSKIKLRKIALFIDLIRFKFLLKKLAKEKYDYLLSDRYYYDNLINIAYLSNENNSCSMFHVPCSMEIPRPDHAFYLKTDPESIMERDRVPDQGLEYLKKKKTLLDLFAKENNLTIIDGNRSKEEIFEGIKRVVN